MKTLKAIALKSGDTIGIVAPAGVVDRAALDRGIEMLHSMGYRTLLGRQVLSRKSFFAGSHRARLADFNAMIRNPKVRAIFCARGGYGAVYLLNGLDYEALRRNPKIIMGASDITILLNEIYARTRLITFHGPMVATNFSKGKAGIDVASLGRAISPEQASPWSLDLYRENILRRGKARGRLAGGCLSLLVSTLGAPYEIDTAGSILFLEDVNEAPYRINRLLKQLEDAGKLRRVRGVVFGDMVNCSDSKHPQWTTRRVIADFFQRFPGPVAMGMRSGHTRFPFVSLPIGAQVTLDTTKRPKLIIEEATTSH